MEKETTIYDLAARLQLSAATVSRALQNHPAISAKTKARIYALAEQTGYRTNLFARNLRSRQTHTLGVIVPRLDSYFMSTVIAGMENAAGSEGYKLIISQSLEEAAKEAASAKTLFSSRVDGLLVSVANNTKDEDHFDAYRQKNIPLVFFDRVPEQQAGQQVMIDNKKAAYAATSHLIQQGCKRIIYITAMHNRNVYAHRLEGYKQALSEHDIPFKNSYVVHTKLSQEEGRRAAAIIRGMQHRPDGIFVANDNCAAGCMAALKEAGISVPDDIAIIGFNNDPVCTVVEPRLSSVHYPGYEMGQLAANRLIQLLGGGALCQENDIMLLPTDLVVRQSSVKAKQI
jgi:LacI family transcriptional regulator